MEVNMDYTNVVTKFLMTKEKKARLAKAEKLKEIDINRIDTITDIEASELKNEPTLMQRIIIRAKDKISPYRRPKGKRALTVKQKAAIFNKLYDNI
jgi:hypothetical protein